MRKLYIATAVVALLVALVTLLPARLAWQWWGQPPAVLIAPQGTVFQGQATFLGLPPLLFEALRWDAHYWPLLTARMRYDLEAETAGYPVTTELTLSPTGSLTLHDLQAGLPVATLAAIAGLPTWLDGLLAVNMDRLKVKNEQLLQAQGQAEIRNAQWTLMKPNLQLGVLHADISTDNEVITARLSSSGPLDISGQAQLNPDGSYTTDIGLRARPEAEARLSNLLKTLGRPVDGWYRIKLKGSLPGAS